MKTGRPPHLSVAMPSGRRKIAPVRTGVPISHPICAASQSKTPLLMRYVMRTPYIIQQAKQTVNAVVFAPRTIQEVRVRSLFWSVTGYAPFRPRRPCQRTTWVRRHRYMLGITRMCTRRVNGKNAMSANAPTMCAFTRCGIGTIPAMSGLR